MKNTPWTIQEIELLKSSTGSSELAVKMGRTYNSVANRRRQLNLPPRSAPLLLKTSPPLPPPEFGRLSLKAVDHGSWFRYGLVADTHLCCKEERLAELHSHYATMAREGIKTVFHAGNIVDGYVPRLNGGNVFDCTIDGQADYVVHNYPRVPGMITYFITGADHEGWWQKEGFNFGAYLQYLAETAGRHDLRYIGHVEADVELKHRSGSSTIIKIQHPGGGSAYARTYAAQKQLESWEGGEKPNILVQGHYHVSGYFQDRNTHVISMPGFKDQDTFARQHRLRMEVGGAILEFKVNPDDGTVTRCRVEFNRFFTRGYYKPYLKSDVRILKGHLILTK